MFGLSARNSTQEIVTKIKENLLIIQIQTFRRKIKNLKPLSKVI